MTSFDISTLNKPQSAVTTIRRAQEYLAHMRDANRPVNHVAFRRGDYDQILRSINSKRALGDAVDELHIGSVVVTRGNA